METNTSSTVNVDRISDFPPPLLHHIMSFLSLEQVVKTRLLSKTWKKLWHTFPNVEYVYGQNRAHSGRQTEVLKYLEQFLLNRQLDAISLEKFTLRVELLSSDPDLESIMNRCLSYAFARFCKLEPPRSTVTLPSLRKLCLSFVYVDDEVIRDMVAGCPLIEYMNINNCRGLKSLQLLGHNKLKEIKLYSNQFLLERGSVNGLNVRSADIKVLNTLCEVNVAFCKNLTRLQLNGLSITDEWLYNQISELPFLEYLAIRYCMKLRCINISSHRLKELVFERSEELVEFKLGTPNLSIFKCCNHVESFSLNALALSQTLLCFISHSVDNEWYLKFSQLLAKFNLCSNVLNLQCNHEAVVVPREWREILCPPLTYCKHFSYKKKLAYEGETPPCCQSLPLSCWKHCIEEVKIECVEKYPTRQIYRESFPSEDREIMVKIDDLWRSLRYKMIYDLSVDGFV